MKSKGSDPWKGKTREALAARIGDKPIEARHAELMRSIAEALDEGFNGATRPRKVGFVLMVFNFGDEGRCNYISNANREDVTVLLREQLARFEGMPGGEGHG